MWRAVRVSLIAAVVARASDDDDDEEAPASAPDPNTTKPYVKPDTSGLHWVETFDGDVWSRWSASAKDGYNGVFKVEQRKREALIGDLGLHVPEEAKKYGAATVFKPLQGKKDVPFVVQFEVKFQDGLSCGGSYIKLFDSEGKDPKEFKDDTRYVIMFGPDKCGATDKVHFILQHKNPKTGEYEEKAFKDAPSVPSDGQTHLYGLVIRPDNTFDVLIDGQKKASGDLLTKSMEPTVNPPKEIDDPEDSKPKDWVDEAKMDDPEAKKPGDWDEDAPSSIPDPQATKPSGWLDDAEKRIPDPDAKQPEDWDVDEDGEWEAPIVDNPACKVGCGKWEHPTISNPDYKGKWYAPKIDNPLYKGQWSPRQIDNPNYFLDETPCILPKIDAVGIDIWTMSKGIIFDNIAIGSDPAKAEAFADKTWKIRSELEEMQKPKPPEPSMGDRALDALQMPYVQMGIAAACVVFAACVIWFCCCSGTKQAAPAAAADDKKKEDAPADAADAGDAAGVLTTSDKTEGGSTAAKRSKRAASPSPNVRDAGKEAAASSTEK